MRIYRPCLRDGVTRLRATLPLAVKVADKHVIETKARVSRFQRLSMSASTGIGALAVPFALVVGVGPFSAAHGQTPSFISPGGPVVGTARPAPPAPPPPPGVPGAAGGLSKPAPAPPNQNELSPNTALFDAINRGDLTAAREAIGRGAQLNARNVLGMTPLELAVDLGRNDIAFLLLSILHEGGAAASSAGPALALSVPPAPAAVPNAGAAGVASAAGAGGSVAELLVASKPGAAIPAPAARAVQPRPGVPPGEGPNDPDPAAGFLGFSPGAGGASRN